MSVEITIRVDDAKPLSSLGKVAKSISGEPIKSEDDPCDCDRSLKCDKCGQDTVCENCKNCKNCELCESCEETGPKAETSLGAISKSYKTKDDPLAIYDLKKKDLANEYEPQGEVRKRNK
jgi:hypothetical protein